MSMPLIIPQTVALLLFCIGLYGVMSSKVGIKMLISLEIMINSAVLNLISVAGSLPDPIVLALFVIAIAAIESVVGFSLAIRYTPAVTMVAACISADTVVGPSIASGIHTWRGKWAVFGAGCRGQFRSCS